MINGVANRSQFPLTTIPSHSHLSFHSSLSLFHVIHSRELCQISAGVAFSSVNRSPHYLLRTLALAVYGVCFKKACPRLRDPASVLALSSRNLGRPFIFEALCTWRAVAAARHRFLFARLCFGLQLSSAAALFCRVVTCGET